MRRKKQADPPQGPEPTSRRLHGLQIKYTADAVFFIAEFLIVCVFL